MFNILGKFNCKNSFSLISSVLLKEASFDFYLKHIHHVFFVIARKMCSHIASNVRLGMNIQVYLIWYCTIRVKLRN